MGEKCLKLFIEQSVESASMNGPLVEDLAHLIIAHNVEVKKFHLLLSAN